MYEILKSSPTKICVVYTFRKEGAKIPFIKKSEINIPKNCTFDGNYKLFQTSPKEFISLIFVTHKPTRKKIVLLLASRKFKYRFIQFHNPTVFLPDIKINKAYLPSIKFDHVVESHTDNNKTIGLLRIVDQTLLRGFYLVKQEDKRWELSIRNITVNERHSGLHVFGNRITFYNEIEK